MKPKGGEVWKDLIMGANFLSILGMAYALGEKSQQLDGVMSLAHANSAMIVKTREGIDDKIDRLLSQVSELKVQISKLEGEIRRGGH